MMIVNSKMNLGIKYVINKNISNDFPLIKNFNILNQISRSLILEFDAGLFKLCK